jgi:hypothetical protein
MKHIFSAHEHLSILTSFGIHPYINLEPYLLFVHGRLGLLKFLLLHLVKSTIYRSHPSIHNPILLLLMGTTQIDQIINASASKVLNCFPCRKRYPRYSYISEA